MDCPNRVVYHDQAEAELDKLDVTDELTIFPGAERAGKCCTGIADYRLPAKRQHRLLRRSRGHHDTGIFQRGRNVTQELSEERL